MKTEFLSGDPVDAMIKAAQGRTAGPWWHVATENDHYLVKAGSMVEAIWHVRQADPDGPKCLFAHKGK